LDINEAIKSADFIYTDTWIDMEFFSDPKFAKEKDNRIKIMKKYQINEKLLEKNDAYIMHDMPIHRGYEISDEVIENSKSIIYEQSENRLYSAKSILLKLIS
jgi:ornithine carbamoyltransferase